MFMKQLDLKATASPSLLSYLYNPLRLALHGYYWLAGRWRLYWNCCPECNSFSPRIHSCDVCHSNTKAYFHWSKDIEQQWWLAYQSKHGMVR